MELNIITVSATVACRKVMMPWIECFHSRDARVLADKVSGKKSELNPNPVGN